MLPKRGISRGIINLNNNLTRKYNRDCLEDNAFTIPGASEQDSVSMAENKTLDSGKLCQKEGGSEALGI